METYILGNLKMENTKVMENSFGGMEIATKDSTKTDKSTVTVF